MQLVPTSLRMFFQPRQTMRWILVHDPNYGVMMIAMLAGITAALRSSVIHGLHPLPDLMGLSPLLDEVITYGIGPSAGIPMTMATIGVYGAVLGVMLVLFGALFLLVLGWILGGEGRYSEVRSALSWSFVPYSWLMPLWGGLALWRFEEVRAWSFTYGIILPWELDGLFAFMLFVDYAIRIFCLVWLVLKLSVALRVSSWRAAVVVVLAFTPLALLLVPWQGFGF